MIFLPACVVHADLDLYHHLALLGHNALIDMKYILIILSFLAIDIGMDE